jgi:hypothetical protein
MERARASRPYTFLHRSMPFLLSPSLSLWIRCYSIQSDPSDSACGVSLWLCLALVGRSRPDALISTLCVGDLFIPQGKTKKKKKRKKEEK